MQISGLSLEKWGQIKDFSTKPVHGYKKREICRLSALFRKSAISRNIRFPGNYLPKNTVNPYTFSSYRTPGSIRETTGLTALAQLYQLVKRRPWVQIPPLA
jgi:hypothetical protein